MNPRTDIVQVAALLVAARTVVADPARWCAYPHALDANGHRCEGRANSAACWGALGALDRAAADADASHRIFLEARRQANQASVTVADSWTGTAWVLDYDAAHSMTVAIFDEAIRAMPRPEAPGAVDILTIARTLIARPDRWAQGAAARDANGEPVGVEHEDAVSWCATGALNCAMYRHAESLDVPTPLQRARNRAGKILTDTVRALTLGHYTEATTYNDQTNHGCIVHAFDIAIADAARPCSGRPNGGTEGAECAR